MKLKLHTGLICIIMGIMLAGCSGNHEENGLMQAAADSSMTPIKVELSWSPEAVTAGDTISIKAVVTQDGQPVDDAREVQFEIAGGSDAGKSVVLEGKSSGDGAYGIDHTFGQAGKYTITSHVTARTQHSMPSKELVVEP